MFSTTVVAVQHTVHVLINARRVHQAGLLERRKGRGTCVRIAAVGAVVGVAVVAAGSRGAIDAGYGRALVTIFDANLTTLIAAIVLFQFGTGPIKGFATTLMIGVIANLFTAVFVTRTLFLIWLQRSSMKEIAI